MISFTVIGQPKTAGSKRGFPIRRANGSMGVVITDDNAKSKGWKQQVGQVAADAYSGPLLDGPLRVTFRFFTPRPKGHFGAKGVKASAPPHPDKKPDVLKLARAVEDGLTSVLWRDDAQIVEEILTKAYGEPARVEVQVESIA